MTISAALPQGADAWRNETLSGKAFSFGPDFVLPDAGRLELDFVEMTDGDGEPVRPSITEEKVWELPGLESEFGQV